MKIHSQRWRGEENLWMKNNEVKYKICLNLYSVSFNTFSCAIHSLVPYAVLQGKCIWLILFVVFMKAEARLSHWELKTAAVAFPGCRAQATCFTWNVCWAVTGGDPGQNLGLLWKVDALLNGLKYIHISRKMSSKCEYKSAREPTDFCPVCQC